jgi:hypothetical protein
MEVIACIEKTDLIRKVLQHLGLWDRPQRSPPSTLLPHKLEAFLDSLIPQQAQQVRAQIHPVRVSIFESEKCATSS